LLLSDATRTEVIERAGYRVIRFWNDYVLNDVMVESLTPFWKR